MFGGEPSVGRSFLIIPECQPLPHRIECCAQPFGLFVEQCRPARIVVDDLDLIHLLDAMIRPLGIEMWVALNVENDWLGPTKIRRAESGASWWDRACALRELYPIR